MRARVVLGIDPDMWHIGVAIVDADGVQGVNIVSQYGRPSGEKAVIAMAGFVTDGIHMFIMSTGTTPDKVVVENQNLYLKGKANPGSILRLGQVAGMCVLVARQMLPEAEILMPSPQLWKGSIPKHVKHKRILDSVGWESYQADAKTVLPTVPEELQGVVDISKRNWTHAIDAIGLAKWGLG